MIGLLAGGGVQGRTPDDVALPALAPIGPLGYWKGDDAADAKSALDSSGNGYDGTFSPGSGTSDQAATIKEPNTRGFTFDGKTGVVTIPEKPIFRLSGDMAVSFWKRKTAKTADYTRLIGKGNGGQRNFGFWECPGDDERMLFQQYNQGGQPVIDLWSSQGTKLNTWVHVLVSVSAGAVSLYFNGQLVGSGLRQGDPGISADPLTFGFAGFHTYFPGQLDDIRLYNRSLSMSEIVYLAQGNGAPAPASALASKSASPTQVTLAWTPSPTPPPAGTATYYLVKRSTEAGKGYAVVGSLLTHPVYIDTRIEAGKTYFYQVTAVNTGGESGPTNEISVAVPK